MSIQQTFSRRGLVIIATLTAGLIFFPLIALTQQTSSYKWPATLTEAGLSTPTASYAMAAAMAVKLQEATGMKVRVIPQDISAARVTYVKKGLAELFHMNVSTLTDAIEGLSFYATRELGPVPLRIQWVNGLTGTGFIVRGDSNIKTIYDIKPGTRVANLTTVPKFSEVTNALLAWVKLERKDMKFVPVSNFRANVWSVVDGSADVCISATIASSSFEAASTPHGTRWLSIPVDKDPEGLKRFLKVSPSAIFDVNKYGPECTLGVIMLREDNVVCALEDSNEEFMYQLAKWKVENFGLYKNAHPFLYQNGVENMRACVDKVFAPVHKGVVRYLKEIGKWTPADDAWQKELIDLMARYRDAYKVALERADKMGIKIDPLNKEWLNLWQNYKEEIGLPRFKGRT